MWGKLRALNNDALRRRLGKYVTSEQLDALEARRQLLVKHFDQEIAARGENAVLYDPRKQPFRLPSASIPAKRTSILGSACAVAAVRCDELDSVLRELCIEPIGLVRVVPNEPFGRLLYQTTGQSGVNERDFMRRGTVDLNRDGSPITVGDRHCWKRRGDLGPERDDQSL